MLMNLAQLNIGKILYPMEDARMSGFADRLADVNALAERSRGFVWRLEDDDDLDGATSLRLPGTTETLVNMSVWEDVETLFQFVYKTVHKRLVDDRMKWFEPLSERHTVLWWIEKNHTPTLDEAAERLDRIRKDGPGPLAFDFESPFGAAGTPMRMPHNLRTTSNVT